MGKEIRKNKKKKTNKILLSQCLDAKKKYTLENTCHLEGPSQTFFKGLPQKSATTSNGGYSPSGPNKSQTSP